MARRLYTISINSEWTEFGTKGICVYVRTGTRMQGTNMSEERAFMTVTDSAHLSVLNQDITTIFY